MTQTPVGLEADQLDDSQLGQPPKRQPPGAAYLQLLRLPGAARFSVAALIGRMPMSMFGLGTVLLVAASTGRYSLAGLVAGVGSIAYAACAPPLARMTDRFGQRRVLRPLAAVFAATCILFVACAELHSPSWVLIVTGALAGASMPSLGSMVRARWSALLGDSPALHSAFALESVADEMIFVVGPALVTLLATSLPPAGVLVAMALAVAGTLALAAQRNTEPKPRALATLDSDAPGRIGRLPAPGLVIMAPVYFWLGAQFASIDLSTVDFAQRHGHKPLAGLILGTYAFGSAIGGLWYGSRHWGAPLERRFAITLALTVAGVATFWAQPGLITLDLSALVAGLTISPTLIAGYGLIERQAPPTRRTEAMTWLSSAISVGVALGSAACGHIIDTLGPRWGYGFAALCGAVAITICVLGLRRLRASYAPGVEQWVDA